MPALDCRLFREDFTAKNRNRNTYICALHWPGEKGPTEEFPDPLKANLTPEQVKMASAPKRKAPTIRSGLVKKEKAILSDELGPLPFEPKEPSDKGESLPSDSEEQKESKSKDIVKEQYECVRTGRMVSDEGCQTEFSKYLLSAKVETMMLQNEVNTMKSSEEVIASCIPYQAICNNSSQMKHFAGLTSPQFEALFNFLNNISPLDDITYGITRS